MRRWIYQSTGGAFICLLYGVSVAMMVAYHRSKYLANIDASVSGLCFLAAMSLAIVLVFIWPNSRLYHLWIALAGLGFAFALAYCLIEESFFRPYPNLIESGNRRIAYGCLAVVMFLSVIGSILWRYKAQRLAASEIIKSPVLQGLWALLAWILSFLGMATINDSIYPLNNYDVRWLILATIFAVLFVIPWIRVWVVTVNRTPVIFDACVVFLIGWLAGELATWSRSHYRPLSSSLDDFGNWEIVYLPFIVIAYFVLRWASQKRFYPAVAVSLGATLAALLYVTLTSIVE